MEVIRVENLGKLYDLGQVGTGTLSRDLNRWWARVRGKEDPYTRIGQINDRTKKSKESEVVWALKDIDFSIQKGEVVGIIGRNGAGKSTLLKIISRITTPSQGQVKIKGRIASLLEVGTGFHPEMTGRENIFMNGTLLGMTRREVQSKLDQIVDFSGVSLYVDTPVKRYSSGMQVRLAFAVAAFLDPEILIVDEVLAVGDAEFQRKAIGRMQEISKGDGRTVLFVSHNMGSFSLLCNRGIVLDKGRVNLDSTTKEAVDYYIHHLTSSNFANDQSKENRKERRGSGDVRITYVETFDKNNNSRNEFSTGEEVTFKFRAVVNRVVDECSAMIVIKDVQTGISVASTEKLLLSKSKFSQNEILDFSVLVPKIPLQQGTYEMKFWLGHRTLNFDVLDDKVRPLVITNPIDKPISGLGVIHLDSFIK